MNASMDLGSTLLGDSRTLKEVHDVACDIDAIHHRREIVPVSPTDEHGLTIDPAGHLEAAGRPAIQDGPLAA
jgi:hypothetical protein